MSVPADPSCRAYLRCDIQSPPRPMPREDRRHQCPSSRDLPLDTVFPTPTSRDRATSAITGERRPFSRLWSPSPPHQSETWTASGVRNLARSERPTDRAGVPKWCTIRASRPPVDPGSTSSQVTIIELYPSRVVCGAQGHTPRSSADATIATGTRLI